MSFIRALVVGLLVISVVLPSSLGVAAPINAIAPGSLTGSGLITFDDVAGGTPPGTNYDSILTSGGATMAERFVGQSVTTVGTFDQLSGSPSGPLALQVGLPGRNVAVSTEPLNPLSTQLLYGLGPTGFPNGDAFAEGAVAVLFSLDQSQIGITISGFTGGGTATLQFFRRDGTLIDVLGVTGVGTQAYGFSREGAVHDIAGVAIFNNDLGGLGYDNIAFDAVVPEPATLLLFGTTAAGLGLARWRQRRRAKQQM